MWRMRLFSCLLLLTAVAVAASGCRTRLDFPSGGTFHSAYQINDGIIIAVPDDLEDRTYNVKVGRLWESRVFVIPVLDAYRTETVARMGGVFRQGVVFASHSVLEDIEMMGAPTAKTEEATARELDSILRELAQEEQTRRGIFSGEARRQELSDEALRGAALETVEQRGGNYVLYFQDALFGFPNGRATVNFRVQLIDRRTGNVLLNKRYTGSSSRFSPHRSHRTNEINLVRHTKMAFAGAMRDLIRDVAVAIDGEA